MGKVVKSIGKAVGDTVNSVGKGLEKIGQGKIGEGLGDISQAGTRATLDAVTLGNKSAVNDLTGGTMDTIEGASRGNTKDLARIGVTAGAVALGGPMAGLAANQAFASGADALQASLAGVAGSGGDAAKVVGIANNLMNTTPKPAPTSAAPLVTQEQPQTIVIPNTPAQSNNNNQILMIGGGGLVLMLVLILITQRK